jgi:DnaA regulatory inactivator Hda
MAEQLPFDLGHRAAFARDDFWVSDSNRDAVAWLDKWPDWPAPFLLIHGPVSCGKTHLLNVWRQETGAAVFDAAAFDPRRVAAARPCAVVDDIDNLIGVRDAEEQLLHLYNMHKERGGFLLAAARTPPVQWPFAVPDLRSRLMAAPSVTVQSPDDQLLAVVLTKLFSDRQLFVSQDVVSFILSRAGRSFAALTDIVSRVDRRALVEKRAVTIPLVREVLSNGG